MKLQSNHIFKQKKGLKFKKAVLIADIISASILLLFLYTAVNKLLDYEHFKSVMIMSPLLHPFAGTIAWVLPIGEIGIVLLLLFPKTKLNGLYTAFVAIVIFTLYIIYMIIFTPRLPCSCGGVLKSLTWTQHIYFNLFLLLLTGIAIVLSCKIKKGITVPP
jgi:hypothetical protein